MGKAVAPFMRVWTRWSAKTFDHGPPAVARAGAPRPRAES